MLQDVAAVVWLGIVPGAVLAALPRSGAVDRITRLALCAAFSPGVVALAMALGLAAGLDAVGVAWAVSVASAPLAWLLVRRVAGDPTPGRAPLGAAFAIGVAVPIGWLALLWLSEPGYRAFGRHNLMHADLIYQLVRAPWPPEATELAGQPMGYGWLGHGFDAALGLVAGHAPTRLFPWANALALAATAALVGRSARQLGAGAPAAALAAALALLACHPTLAPAFWLGGGVDASRLVAPVTKFLFLDLMPASFPLLAAILWSATRPPAEEARQGSAAWLGALAFPVLALVYMAALPAGLCVVAGVASAEAVRHAAPRAAARRHGLSLLLGLAALVAGTWSAPGGPAVPALLLTPAAGIAEKAREVLIGFGPWWLLASPSSLRSWRAGRPALAGLMLGAAVLAAAYAVLLAKNLEYKLVLYAAVAIAPGLALTLLPPPSRGRSTPDRPARWAIAAALALVAAAVSLPRAFDRVGMAQLQAAVPLDESRFHLRWDDPDQAGWIEALRAETTPDTVLVALRCPVVLGAFADRSLYVPCLADGRDVAGYTLWVDANLWVFRGHPRALLRARRETAARLQRALEPDAFFAALDEVRALGRPVALQLPARDRKRPAWLAERGLGREIHADSRYRLWWVPVPR